MPATFTKSQELFNRAKNTIAGGVNSGIRKLEQPVPIYFQKGSGPRVWDVDGNETIDYQLGQGALLYGHAPAGLPMPSLLRQNSASTGPPNANSNLMSPNASPR